jgi:hypothetical protein
MFQIAFSLTHNIKFIVCFNIYLWWKKEEEGKYSEKKK